MIKLWKYYSCNMNMGYMYMGVLYVVLCTVHVHSTGNEMFVKIDSRTFSIHLTRANNHTKQTVENC